MDILLLSAFVSVLAIFSLASLAPALGLLDIPTERKRHQGEVPLIGGIAIFLATVCVLLVSYPGNQLINLYVISSALIVVLGAADDRYQLSVGLRLLVQVLVACILVFGAQLTIHNFGAMFGFSVDIGMLGAVVSIVAVLAAINAFNMADGIDGLAGSLSLNTFLSIAILFYLSNYTTYLVLPLAVSVALFCYLFFNLGLVPGPVKRIFLGDAGSMFIGLTVIWLLTLGTQGEQPAFRTVTALWVIAVPLMDMTAIVFRRLKKGQSPFMADRNHLHHIFMRAGFCPRVSLGLIFSFSLLYSAIGIAGEIFAVPEAIMFYGFLLTFSLYMWGINHAWRLTKWISVKPKRS